MRKGILSWLYILRFAIAKAMASDREVTVPD
jgi:hypothetical protein